MYLHVTLLKSTPLDNINLKKVQLIEKKSISIISSGFSLWSDISNLPPIFASGIEGRPSDPCTYAMWTAKKKTQLMVTLSGMLFTARRHITNSQVHKQSIQLQVYVAVDMNAVTYPASKKQTPATIIHLELMAQAIQHLVAFS